MNIRKLIVVSMITICSALVLCSTAISGEYKSQTFPNDQVIISQAWEAPIKILGKQKLSNDEYRLVYSIKDGGVSVMTLIKLDTNLWYHPLALGLRAGILTETKR
jgi:hypothetical protein